MKNIIALSCVLLASTVAMAEVKIAMQMNIAGKTMDTIMVFNQDARMNSASEDGVKIEVMAFPEGENEVVISMKIFIDNDKAEPCLVAAPMVKTALDEGAQISMKNEKGDVLVLTILATK